MFIPWPAGTSYLNFFLIFRPEQNLKSEIAFLYLILMILDISEFELFGIFHIIAYFLML